MALALSAMSLQDFSSKHILTMAVCMRKEMCVSVCVGVREFLSTLQIFSRVDSRFFRIHINQAISLSFFLLQVKKVKMDKFEMQLKVQ